MTTTRLTRAATFVVLLGLPALALTAEVGPMAAWNGEALSEQAGLVILGGALAAAASVARRGSAGDSRTAAPAVHETPPLQRPAHVAR